MHLISTNCQTSSKLKAHDSLALLILSLFVQNIYRLLFLLWLLSFHILTALNVTSIKYDCKNVMRLRSVYLRILISSDGWCVSEWSAGHTRMEESEKSSPLSKGVMHKVQIQSFWDEPQTELLSRWQRRRRWSRSTTTGSMWLRGFWPRRPWRRKKGKIAK